MEIARRCREHVWIKVNIVLYSGYAVFGLASFFWPTPIRSTVYIILHVVTLAVYGAIIYGLAARRFPVNYAVVIISPFMIAHLIAFTLSPLGMELAYMGPSRSFYFFYLTMFSLIMSENALGYSLIIINMISIFIHAVNFCYFMRKNTAKLFVHAARF